MEEALSVEEKQSELKDSLIERSERECKDQKKRIEKLSKSLATAQEGVVKQEGNTVHGPLVLHGACCSSCNILFLNTLLT